MESEYLISKPCTVVGWRQYSASLQYHFLISIRINSDDSLCSCYENYMRLYTKSHLHTESFAIYRILGSLINIP